MGARITDLALAAAEHGQRVSDLQRRTTGAVSTASIGPIKRCTKSSARSPRTPWRRVVPAVPSMQPDVGGQGNAVDLGHHHLLRWRACRSHRRSSSAGTTRKNASQNARPKTATSGITAIATSVSTPQ